MTLRTAIVERTWPPGHVRFGTVGLPTSRPYAIEPIGETVTCL